MENILPCPCCQSEYNRIVGVKILRGAKDDYKSPETVSINESIIETVKAEVSHKYRLRGIGISVQMICEICESEVGTGEWQYEIMFHKGMTFVDSKYLESLKPDYMAMIKVESKRQN